jgi:transcriptional regulator with XRE-family HTH domain
LSESQQRERDLFFLGQAIGQLREERGLSKAELAAATGSEQTRIQALEAGQLDPDYELLLALAEALGIRPSAFVVRAEELQAEPRASG